MWKCLFVLFFLLSTGSVSYADSYISPQIRGENEYVQYLLEVGNSYWEDLKDIFSTRPPHPVFITFYDGRYDYIHNLPHPSAPKEIDAVQLFNRIHMVVEKRQPFTNKMVLFHELVHIFQKEYFRPNPYNIWFADIQAEYILGKYFFGPKYHANLRQNLNFNPKFVLDNIPKTADWRYNHSLGIVIMDYLLDRYGLNPDQMFQLISALQSDNLLQNAPEVVRSALSYLAEEENTYSFISPDEKSPGPPVFSDIKPTPNSFCIINEKIVFHAFRFEDTFHSLGKWSIGEKDFQKFIKEETYLDWPATGLNQTVFYVRRTGDYYELWKTGVNNPPGEKVFSSPDYLSHLHYDQKKNRLLFARDRGPFRHIYALKDSGEIKQLTSGENQNWSPVVSEEHPGIFFLSTCRQKDALFGGDLFLYNQGEIEVLTENKKLMQIIGVFGNKLLIEFFSLEETSLALGIFNLDSRKWEKTIFGLPHTPYFPYIEEDRIKFWINPSAGFTY